jgi:hypothetical protein
MAFGSAQEEKTPTIQNFEFAMPQKRTKNTTAGADTGTEAEESPQDVEAKLSALVEELEVEGAF